MASTDLRARVKVKTDEVTIREVDGIWSTGTDEYPTAAQALAGVRAAHRARVEAGGVGVLCLAWKTSTQEGLRIVRALAKS